MGTRATILITGAGPRIGPKDQTVRLYKHWSGAPDAVLDKLATATSLGNEYLLEHGPYLNGLGGKTLTLADMPAASFGHLVVHASFGWDEPTIRLDDDDGNTPALWGAPLHADHFGFQSDLEWVYVINLSERTIAIYGNAYGDAAKLMERGTVDPALACGSYIDDPAKAYQERHFLATRKHEGTLRQLGWTFVPPTKILKREQKTIAKLGSKVRDYLAKELADFPLADKYLFQFVEPQSEGEDPLMFARLAIWADNLGDLGHIEHEAKLREYLP